MGIDWRMWVFGEFNKDWAVIGGERKTHSRITKTR